jgi:pimeloyl-ACP methyl ester carboxylesterase
MPLAEVQHVSASGEKRCRVNYGAPIVRLTIPGTTALPRFDLYRISPLKKGDPGYDYVLDLQNHLHLFQNTPVLIAWGMKDVVFDHHFLQKWIEYLPQAEVHRFDDCGHYILEDAQEEIGKLIVDFLAK